MTSARTGSALPGGQTRRRMVQSRTMRLICRQSRLHGEVRVPGSKSHTIRAVAIASLAAGESQIRAPLDSADTRAAVAAYRALGAGIEVTPELWRVTGTGGDLRTPDDVIDVANSGVTLCTAMGVCALLREGAAVLTGDEQIRRRPAGPLAASLTDLGADARSTRGSGLAPFVVSGRLRGGETTIEATNSQHLSSLLMSAPLADGDSTIHVPVLNEAPYVEMTLDWLARQGVRVEHQDLREFRIAGGQRYQPVARDIPADWSSATFFLGAGALGYNEVTLRGLDLDDTQGDKAVADMVRQMGADVEVSADAVRVRSHTLHGCELDLNATPDALPMLAVLACFADGTTTLANVPQARAKETDRIAVMTEELAKMGGRLRELPDGLVIESSKLRTAEVDGHGDHRVVMALAIAGCSTPGTTVINNAEAMAVTFPQFVDCMRALGAEIESRQ
jgi:3-phosphoshikimate 1-carboxyvinyltransferase